MNGGNLGFLHLSVQEQLSVYSIRRPSSPLSKPVDYLLYRPTPQTASVEMENMEDAPMTRGTSGREEDT